MFSRTWLMKVVVIVAAAAITLPAVAERELLDPTRPPSPATSASNGKSAAVPSWRLESTLISDYRRVAVINGQKVREGNDVGGARVKVIRRNAVVLMADGREIVLKEPAQLDVKQKKGT